MIFYAVKILNNYEDFIWQLFIKNKSLLKKVINLI